MERLSEIFLPPQRSTFAHEVDSLFHFINIAGFILFMGILIAIVYFAVKYRRKSEDDVTPVITHHTGLEVTWSVLPAILILIIFSWGFRGFLSQTTAPANTFDIYVTAGSWYWAFEYPNGGRLMNELYIPTNRPVKLIMTSEDVLHSFAVPDYRVKQDVIPNRYTTLWFEVTEPGESIIFCTEYCGTQHSNMIAPIYALSPEDFEEWLETGLQPDEDMPLLAVGQAAYTSAGCNACHTLDGTRRVGPSFAGLYMSERQFTDGTTAIADEEYLIESIVDPHLRVTVGYPNNMPQNYRQLLTERQIQGLVEFIKEQQ